MQINFNAERMESVRKTHRKWWQGELERALIISCQKTREPENVKIPVLSQETCTDFSVSPEEIVERYEQELACYEFLGDAFPKFCLDSFGPGVAAAFFGARLDNSSGAVWFYPPEKPRPIEELHIQYDPENVWARRIKDIMRAGVARWQGRVIVGYPDFGGVMDILAAFRTSEQLLFDLYDYPEEVTRLVGKIHAAWLDAFADFTAALGPDCGGYTDWNGVYSEKPAYIQQCDFSYMIGPNMFREFALDEIREMSRRLGRCTYHLDGMGCLPNLDDLLSIEEIRLLQWVPGAGNPHGVHWLKEYRRILEAGKSAQIVGSFQDFEDVAAQLGDAKGLCYVGCNDGLTAEMLKKYGAES